MGELDVFELDEAGELVEPNEAGELCKVVTDLSLPRSCNAVLRMLAFYGAGVSAVRGGRIVTASNVSRAEY